MFIYFCHLQFISFSLLNLLEVYFFFCWRSWQRRAQGHWQWGVVVGLCCSCFVGDDTVVRLGVEVVCSPSIPVADGSPANLWENIVVPRRVGGWIVERTRMEPLSCWSPCGITWPSYMPAPSVPPVTIPVWARALSWDTWGSCFGAVWFRLCIFHPMGTLVSLMVGP